MQFELAHLIETAERNAAEGRVIAEAQRALVEKLRAAGQDTTVAREMLRVAEATQAMFEALTSRNRYAVLYRVTTAKRADTRARRIEEFVAMLARGETPYPQKRRA